MSKLNSITTCDYIDYDKALNMGMKAMQNKKTELIGFYIVIAINTGIRISDLRTITWDQLQEGKIRMVEQKTNKPRFVIINEAIKRAMDKCTNANKQGLVFISQKNTVITTQQINRLLKVIFRSLLPTHCISSHSLRKTFGRRVYENNNRSEDALIKLSELFNHSSLKLTRIYLGIRQEELNDIYLNF